MIAPPKFAIEAAEQMARRSPCSKSKRGAAIYWANAIWPGDVIAMAHNGPPEGIACDASEACRASCGHRCAHAEARAVGLMMLGCSPDGIGFLSASAKLDMLHVKIGPDHCLVAGGPPSCMQCAVAILDAGLGGVWLYETAQSLREGFVGHVITHLRNGPRVEKRVDEYGVASAVMPDQWVRYTALEFYRVTARNCGVHA